MLSMYFNLNLIVNNKNELSINGFKKDILNTLIFFNSEPPMDKLLPV